MRYKPSSAGMGLGGYARLWSRRAKTPTVTPHLQYNSSKCYCNFRNAPAAAAFAEFVSSVAEDQAQIPAVLDAVALDYFVLYFGYCGSR